MVLGTKQKSNAEQGEIVDDQVFIIGIEEFLDSQLPKIAFHHADAVSIQRAFTATEIPPANIEILLGTHATRTNILSRLKKMISASPEVRGTKQSKKLPPKRIYLFYFGLILQTDSDIILTAYDTQLDDLKETGISFNELVNRFKENNIAVFGFMDGSPSEWENACSVDGTQDRSSESANPISGISSDANSHSKASTSKKSQNKGKRKSSNKSQLVPLNQSGWQELESMINSLPQSLFMLAASPGEYSYSSSLLQHRFWGYFLEQAISGAISGAITSERFDLRKFEDYLQLEMPRILRKYLANPATQVPAILGGERQDDLGLMFKFKLGTLKSNRVAEFPPQQLIKLILRSQTTGKLKDLTGYQKHFRLPDANTSNAKKFVGRIAHEDIRADNEIRYARSGALASY